MKNLWLISQDNNNSYETFDSAVVVANTKGQARKIHPDGVNLNDLGPYDKWDNYSWCKPEEVKVTFIGKPKRGLKVGVVCASYNAG